MEQKRSLSTVSDLLASSWNLFVSRGLVTILVSLVPGLFIFVAALVFGILMGVGAAIHIFALSIIGGVGIAIAALIFGVWGQTATYIAMCSEKKLSIKEIFKVAWPLSLGFFIINLFLGIIVAGNILWLLIPGFVFALWFSFTPFVYIEEGVKGFDALLKSREYIRGRFWSLAGRNIAIFLIYIILEVVLSILGNALKSPAATGILSGIVNLAVSPFLLAYTYTMYKDFKQAKGDFVFNPTAGYRFAYLWSGILGLIIMIASTVWVTSSYALSKANYLERSQKQTQLEIQQNNYQLTPTTSVSNQ